MKDKKKQIITISLIIILILAVVGVSYAAFNYVGRGEKINQITTGTISMEYQESDNIISINNALPTTDETGKVRLREGEYFDFSVTTNLSGKATINYEIAASDFEDNTFAGENVKFYLTKIVGSEEVPVNESLPAVYSKQSNENTKTGRPAGMMSLLTGSTSTQGQETTSYRLRLYVNEAYNPQGDGGNLIFKTRINVYGKINSESDDPSMMKSYNGQDQKIREDFHQLKYEKTITKIVTKNDTNIPSTALEIENGKGNYFDVSQAKNDSVIAYLEENGTVMVEQEVCEENGDELICDTIEKETTAYQLTIGSKNKVIANNDSAYLFSDFSNLNEIDLTYLDTSKVTNMSYMFDGNNSLKNLDITGFDTSQVTNMANMFTACYSLTTLDVTNFNTSKVTNMRGMFTACYSLTTLDVTNFNTSKVTNMGLMFSHCESLTFLDVSNFDTSKITDMTDMFLMCSKLTSLDLRKFNTLRVTDMTAMFSGCESLTSLDVSNFNTENVTTMVNMFENCKGLTTLNVSSFNTSKITDMTAMFSGCESLITLDLSNFNTSNVTSMFIMFQSCHNLTNLDLSHFDTSKVTDMAFMFNQCNSLTTLNVSSFDTSKVTNMENMFFACESLTTLDLRSFDTSNVTNMIKIFSDCSGLTKISVSTLWDTSLAASTDIYSDGSTYGTDGMFSSCNITSVTIV